MDARAHVVELNKTRLRLHHQAKAITDRAVSERRDLDAVESAEFDRLMDRIGEIDAERDGFATRERIASEDAAMRESHPGVFGPGRVDDADAEARLIKRFLDPDAPAMKLRVPIAAARRERELLRDGASAFEARGLAYGRESRSLLGDTGSVGSAVPITTAASCYSYLEAQAAVFRGPSTKVDTSSGEAMYMPKFATHPIGTQVIAQGTAIGGTDPTFDRMSLNTYKYGELLQVASEVIQDTQFDIGSLLGMELGNAIGRVVGADLVVGSGSGEPQGLMSAAGTGNAGTVATGGTLIKPTYENLVDLVYSVNSSYRATGSAAWLMADSTAGVIRKIRSDAGGTLGPAMWVPSVTQGIAGGAPDTLLGFPVYTDPSVASCASNARVCGFGAWNAYYTRHVSDLILERSDDFAFNTDLITLRAKWRVGGNLIDNAAFNILKQSVT